MRALPLFVTPEVFGWSSRSSSVGFWHPGPDGGCSLTPLSLIFSPAKDANGVLLLGVHSAYGHHEYLPELIMTGTHIFITNKKKCGMWTAGSPSSFRRKTMATIGLIDKLIFCFWHSPVEKRAGNIVALKLLPSCFLQYELTPHAYWWISYLKGLIIQLFGATFSRRSQKWQKTYGTWITAGGWKTPYRLCPSLCWAPSSHCSCPLHPFYGKPFKDHNEYFAWCHGFIQAKIMF